MLFKYQWSCWGVYDTQKRLAIWISDYNDDDYDDENNDSTIGFQVGL